LSIPLRLFARFEDLLYFWWQKVPKTIRMPFSREQLRSLAERARKTALFARPFRALGAAAALYPLQTKCGKSCCPEFSLCGKKTEKHDNKDSDLMPEPSADGGLKARETGQVCLQTRD